jgi:DNA modification methylase
MANGFKTGGRVKGVSVNKPKVPTVAHTTVAAAVATAPGAGAAPGGILVPTRTRAHAREATDPAFPRYRIVATDKLVAYDRNPRTHSEAQINKLVASIREFGFTNAILTDGKRGIVAGHGRLLAAQKLGMATVPTLELSHLSAAQRRAYVIADNKLALDAGWDDELLRLELGDLREDGFDLSLTGFDGRELSALFGDSAGLTDPDEAPPLPAKPVSVLGDVWILGRHRLVCGDSTTAVSVDAALAGAKPRLMVTDPPYGVAYDADWRNKAMRADGTAVGGRAIGKVMNDDRADWSAAWALFPGSVAYVWHAGLFADVVMQSLRSCRLNLRAQIVWVKTRHVLSRGDYHPQHEPLLYAVRDDADAQWNFVPEHEVASYAVRKGEPGQFVGGRKQSTVWFIEHIKSETGHSTQKPVECMKRPILNNSAPGQAVYDPFVGSGTTIIAAEMTERCCIAIELSPAYVDVGVKRWQSFVGQHATLEATGRTFAETEASRTAPAKPGRIRSPRAKVAA